MKLMMLRYLFSILLSLIGFSAVIGQPSIDGDLSDSEYISVATKQNTNSSFGSAIDVTEIVYYADDAASRLYFGVKGKLDTGSNNGIGIWLNFPQLDGVAAGNDLGGSGGHYMDGDSGANQDFQADFEVDYMFALNPGNGSSNVFYDLVELVGGRTLSFLGQTDQSGIANNNGGGGTADDVFSNLSVVFAFNNGGGADQGFEMFIPYSELGPSGVSNVGAVEIFAFVVSDTGFFSDVTVPGNISPSGSPGFGTKFNNETGGDYHAAKTYETIAATNDWNTAGTWDTNSIPPDGANVLIGHNIQLDVNKTIHDITIDASTTFTGSDGTSAYELTLMDDGEFINNGTSFDASDGKVIFDGDNVISGSTTTTFNDVDISGGVNFGGAEIAGTLDVLAGGFATTGQPPTYNSGSTLQFSTGGDYDITSSLTLWDNSGSGAGVPDNVVINTSELDLQEARTIAGDLTVNNSGNLTLENVGLTVEGDLVNDGLIDFQSGSQQALTVEGNLTNNNAINLSDTGGGDLVLQGDFTDTATFNTNNRALILTGTNAQSIDANPNNTTIDFLNIDKSGGSLQLTDDLSVTNTFTLEDNNTIDLNLNGNTLSLEDDPTIDAGNTGAIDGSATSSTLDLSGNVSNLPDGLLSGNSIQNLELSSSGTVSIDTDLTINNTLNTSNGDHELPSDHVLTLNGELNVNSGTFTLRSDEDNMNPNLSISAQIGNSSGSTFSGDVTVERYVPKSNRAFRYISSPVNTTGSIRDNLQEGVNNTSQADANNQNPNPGFGTHITGSTDGSNGFDATSTGNDSMFEWDESASPPAWVAVPNTDTKKMNIDEAYALMVRGDRSTTLNSNTAVGPATTLRFTGSLVGGNQAVASTNLSATSGDYNLVANPYQAIVDMKALLESADATDLDDQTIYVYDPTIGTQGGYATIDLSKLDPTSTPSGTNADENILPNQAFFVETTGTSPALTFKETYKNTAANFVETFSNDETPEYPEVNINLMRYENNEAITVDGTTIGFSQQFSNTVTYRDADKVWNYDEWFALFNNNNYLAIEKRNPPQFGDQVPFYLGNYQSDAYQFKIDMSGIGRKAVLVDLYTGEETILSHDADTNVEFNVDPNIPESVDSFRFYLEFREAITLGNDTTENPAFKVYPNPVTQNRINIQGLNDQGKVNIKIYSLSGQLIYRTKRSADQEISFRPDITIPTGVYQLQVEQDQKTYRSSLIISNH